MAVEILKEIWAKDNIVFQTLFTIPGLPDNNSLRIKISLGRSYVILIDYKAIILTKISDYSAPTEGTTWAVENLLNLLKRCGGVGSLIRARCDSPPPARPLANRSYLTAYYM
jgi:hypothetical protein